MMRALIPLLVLLSSCMGARSDLTCERGTVESQGECVPKNAPSPSCGPGTQNVGGQCVPVDPVDPVDPMDAGTTEDASSPFSCSGSGNRVNFDGDPGDFIHPGTDTITDATWQVFVSPTDVFLYVRPSDPSQGEDWSLEFSSAMLGEPLAVKVYEDAERAAFASPGHPGLSISGDHRGCNISSGRFEIHRLAISGDTLTDFEVTFEQHCEAKIPALRGCASYTQ